jgi:hypothetical protein
MADKPQVECIVKSEEGKGGCDLFGSEFESEIRFPLEFQTYANISAFWSAPEQSQDKFPCIVAKIQRLEPPTRYLYSISCAWMGYCASGLRKLTLVALAEEGLKEKVLLERTVMVRTDTEDCVLRRTLLTAAALYGTLLFLLAALVWLLIKFFQSNRRYQKTQ